MDFEPPTVRKDAVVVLGMHRSGTSAMTRALSLAGARLPSRLMPPALGNPAGHWEPTDVQEFNDQILGEMQSSWDDVFGPRRNKQGKLPINCHIPRAREIIRQNWEKANFIVLKEPRVSLLLDVWNVALEQEGYRTSFIIMVRHPVEVADSLKSRNSLIRNRSLILWATYMLAAETGTRNLPRMFVTFDALVSDPGIVLDRAESELDIVFPHRSLAADVEIEQFIRDEERHHRSKKSVEIKSFGHIDKYYKFLEAAATGSTWNLDGSSELMSWLRSLEQSVGPILKQLELDRHGADQQAGLANQRAEAAEAASAAAEAELRERLEAGHAELAAAAAAREASEAELRERLEGLAEQVNQVESEATLAIRKAEEARSTSEAELRAQLEGLASESDAVRRQAAEIEAKLAAAERNTIELEAGWAAGKTLLLAQGDELQQVIALRTAELESEKLQSIERMTSLRAYLDAREAELLGELLHAKADVRNARAHADEIEAGFADQRRALNLELAQARQTADLAAGLDSTLAAVRVQMAEQEAALRADLVSAERESREATLRADRLQSELSETKEHLGAREIALQDELARTASRNQEVQQQLADAQAALGESSISRDRYASEARELRPMQTELTTLREQSAQLARSLSEAVSSRRAVDRLSPGQLLWEAIRRIRR